jgi:hypothetical protein
MVKNIGKTAAIHKYAIYNLLFVFIHMYICVVIPQDYQKLVGPQLWGEGIY